MPEAQVHCSGTPPCKHHLQRLFSANSIQTHTSLSMNGNFMEMDARVDHLTWDDEAEK